MDKTKEIIAGMMKENTGRHMLDSGGAYGRHWERNQAREFEEEPIFKIDVWEDHVDVTYNLYHYLTAFLEYSEKWQAKFEEWVENNDRERTPYLADMEEFAQSQGFEAKTINSYNGDTILSQVIQYTVIFEEGADWVYDYEVILLQVHNGCDVRGGYTAPKAFYVHDFSYFLIAQQEINARVSISLDEDLYAFSDDCGFHWYDDFDVNSDDCIRDEENNEVYYVDDDGQKHKVEFSVMYEF